jgi:hypothetical protein
MLLLEGAVALLVAVGVLCLQPAGNGSVRRLGTNSRAQPKREHFALLDVVIIDTDLELKLLRELPSLDIHQRAT